MHSQLTKIKQAEVHKLLQMTRIFTKIKMKTENVKTKASSKS